MAILSSLANVLIFWFLFAINFTLLYLQLFYVATSKRPNTATLAYRIVVAFGFSAAFTYCLIGLIGLVVGWYLQSRSSSRREKILSWARSHDQNGHSQHPREDSQQPSQASSRGSGKAWNGIVGFFHPFWYTGVILLRASSSCC